MSLEFGRSFPVTIGYAPLFPTKSLFAEPSNWGLSVAPICVISSTSRVRCDPRPPTKQSPGGK